MTLVRALGVGGTIFCAAVAGGAIVAACVTPPDQFLSYFLIECLAVLGVAVCLTMAIES